MPLMQQGVSLGCVLLQHRAARRWQPADVELVRLVAAHLSSALMQANTLRKVQALVEERTAQLRHSMDVQAKLYEKSRQQVEQLQRMNQVMEEFLSTVSHELLTPLTSMTMAIKMLREAPLNDTQRDRYLGILDHQCSQETRLIRDLLALQKIESQTAILQLHQINGQTFLQDLQTVWQDSLQEQGICLIVRVPQRPVFHRILVELLTNAKKYSAPGQSVVLQLDVESEQTIPCVKLTVENVGLGILPEEMPMIFEKFRRGQQALQATVPGIGLGLTLTRGLTSHLGGAIAATSTPIAGTDYWRTHFTLTLPLVPG
jgi:signal transduction histidine kinase